MLNEQEIAFTIEQMKLLIEQGRLLQTNEVDQLNMVAPEHETYIKQMEFGVGILTSVLNGNPIFPTESSGGRVAMASHDCEIPAESTNRLSTFKEIIEKDERLKDASHFTYFYLDSKVLKKKIVTREKSFALVEKYGQSLANISEQELNDFIQTID